MLKTGGNHGYAIYLEETHRHRGCRAKVRIRRCPGGAICKDALDTEDTGFSYHRLKAGQRQPFAHKHERAEEVYVVLAGSGRVKLDEEIVELQMLDAIRVAPDVIRAFEAGPSGLDLIAFGPRCDGDGEVLMGWWAD